MGRHYALMGANWATYLARMRRHEADKSGKVKWGDDTTLMAFSCLFNLTVWRWRCEDDQLVRCRRAAARTLAAHDAAARRL